MSIMDIFNKKNNKWTARLEDIEKEVNQDNYEMIIDEALTKVEEGEAEFLVLSPMYPINDLTFLQTCMDEEPGYMHVECGLTKKMDNGRNIVLCKDMLTVGDTFDLFINFYKGNKMNVTDWYTLM